MKTIQKALLKKNNKYLLLKRAKNAAYFPEYWDLPGGLLEEGEGMFEGVEREILEETELKAKALSVAGVYELDLDKKGEKTHKFVVYVATILSGDVHLSSEHTAFKWANKNDILKLKIEPYLRLYFAEHE